MLDYSFIEVLKTLDWKELKEFRKFAVSPYFNKSRKALKLIDAIIKFHPHYDNSRLTKEGLHRKINPEIPYNEITMRRLLYDVQKLLERFMQQVNFEKKNIESRIFMTEEIGSRGAEKLFLKNTSHTEELLESQGIVNSDYCLAKFKMQTDKFYFSMINNKISRKEFANIETAKLTEGITFLISYFMLEAIKHNDTLLSYSRSYNIKQSANFIDQFIRLFDFERLEIFMKKNSITGNHIIKVYLNLLKAFLYFDNEYYYDEFKKSLNKLSGKLSTTDNNFLYTRLASYCIVKNQVIHDKNAYFDRELFAILEMTLAKKFYETETNKYLPADVFRNMLLIALKLNKIKWTEDLISDYSNKLHPQNRTDIVNFSYGMLYFEKGAYDTALRYLGRVKLDESIYRLDLRVLLLKIYYEQGAFDSAFSMMRAYKKYVLENQMLDENKKATHINFIKYITKLINYQRGTNKTDLISVRMQVDKSKHLVQKEWLTNKIYELDKSISIAV